MNYKLVILDLDNTLIDFNTMELGSLKHALSENGVEVTEEIINDYVAINTEMWEGLEAGHYEKKEILTGRFDKLAKKYSLDYDSVEVNSAYLNGMADFMNFMPDAVGVLEFLKNSEAVLVMMTNGVQSAQEAKIKRGHLEQYFDHIIISDEVGYHKPQTEIFEHMIDLSGAYEKNEMIIIGDSLTSDIKGGMNYGIDTCWYNPDRKVADDNYKITYVIGELKELYDIL